MKDSLTGTSARVIEPSRMYSGQELRALVGKTLAASMTGLALCKDHYLGATVLEYLTELGKRRIQTESAKACEQANGDTCTKQTTNPMGWEKIERTRKYDAKKGGRPRFRDHHTQ